MKKNLFIITIVFFSSVFGGCGNLFLVKDTQEENLLLSRASSFWGHGESFYWNGFAVLNNQWGRQYASYGYQAIVKTDNNRIQFWYQWDGDSYHVKGYPTIIAGWHYGQPGGWLTSYGSFGLPSRVWDNKAFFVDLDASHGNQGSISQIMNLSWDIWLSYSDNPSSPDAEIMIWPWRISQQPIGTKQGEVYFWSGYWDVYRGYMSSGGATWPVVSFVRKNTTLRAWGNLKDFINYVKSKNWISNSMYIVGIELGTELLKGQGWFHLEKYTLNP
ncbi:hypothetical protein WKV44_08140 [Spirochaetia bacterium 38H-sp]|uniref:Cellulase n=1 Tax=Rarispira pelagica TaxID=3141764 RepID=A0ABU9UCX1_9SPIR